MKELVLTITNQTLVSLGPRVTFEPHRDGKVGQAAVNNEKTEIIRHHSCSVRSLHSCSLHAVHCFNRMFPAT